jgi:hypothetical protein
MNAIDKLSATIASMNLNQEQRDAAIMQVLKGKGAIAESARNIVAEFQAEEKMEARERHRAAWAAGAKK